LRLAHSRQLRNSPAGLQVDNLDLIGAERSDEQLLSLCVDRQVINPTVNAWQLDSADLTYRRLLRA
jgi:hypothetical protein